MTKLETKRTKGMLWTPGPIIVSIDIKIGPHGNDNKGTHSKVLQHGGGGSSKEGGVPAGAKSKKRCAYAPLTPCAGLGLRMNANWPSTRAPRCSTKPTSNSEAICALIKAPAFANQAPERVPIFDVGATGLRRAAVHDTH